jgi:hypothetical protein
MTKRLNTGMKYNKTYGLKQVRVAKCGHISKIGRYLKCEKCLETLPEDDGDLVYHQTELEPEDFIEENCE